MGRKWLVGEVSCWGNTVELKNKISLVCINGFKGMHRNGKHMPFVKKNTAL